jgi:hypothetical protein
MFSLHYLHLGPSCTLTRLSFTMPYIFKNHSWSLSDNSWSMIDTVSSVVGEHLVSVMTSTTMRRPFTRGGADCSTRLSMLYY